MTAAHGRRPTGRSPRVALRRMAWMAWLALALLILQNVLGMDLNLFVSLPGSESFDALLGSVPILLFHVVNGLALLVIGGVLVAHAASLRNRLLMASSAANLAFVFLAIFFGVDFVIAGQDDALSLLMEAAFLGAVASVVILLVAVARDSLSSPGDGSAMATASEEQG